MSHLIMAYPQPLDGVSKQIVISEIFELLKSVYAYDFFKSVVYM